MARTVEPLPPGISSNRYRMLAHVVSVVSASPTHPPLGCCGQLKLTALAQPRYVESARCRCEKAYPSPLLPDQRSVVPSTTALCRPRQTTAVVDGGGSPHGSSAPGPSSPGRTTSSEPNGRTPYHGARQSNSIAPRSGWPSGTSLMPASGRPASRAFVVGDSAALVLDGACCSQAGHGWSRVNTSVPSARPCASNSPPPCTDGTDRKSTRLNSSHRCISYAVF